MGNLYTDNLIGTVIGLSVADDWEGARREWRIVGCEVDETHSATCVCGKEGLRYVYTIANTETGETLSPIGSSCIKKFEQSDMDEELAGWQQAIKLMEEAARIGKEDYVHLHSGSYSRKLLYFLYEQDAFRPTKYNGYDGYNDYLFLLDMFNGGFCSEAQERKCQPVHEVPEHLRREGVRPGGSKTGFGERGLIIFRNHGSARDAPKGSRPEQRPSAN
ncbi:hypothetical protein [Coprococcus comes]|uniref:hypothetical protein n=1 Tax=Coprococcus comes TaxID=410072 RepID=UPI0018992D5E|nr:hypothetical protein [Coprococcus comes]